MSKEHTAGRFLRSTGAAALSQGWRVMVTFGATFLLRRFIPPEDWGLFSWAMVVFLVLGALRDLGLAYHVLRVEPRPYGNLLALELVWGGVLALGAFLAAPLAEWIYRDDHPDLEGVLRCLALFLFFEGLATVPRTYFEGELRVGRAVWPEVLRNLFFVLLAIGLALGGHGAYSLVYGHVVAAGVYALLLWIRAYGEIPLAWRRGQTLALLRESSPLALIWFLIILTRFIDPLVLALRFESDDLGYYTFAYEWATIVSIQLLLPTVGRALYPALLAFGNRARELFRAYSLATVFVMALEVPTALFLLGNAELVVRIVGGGEWGESPPYLRILCLAPLLDPFSRLGGEVLKAKHLDRLWIASTLVTVLTFGIGGYWATGIWGVVGMAWVNLLPLGGLVMAWSLWRVSREGFLDLGRQLVFVYLLPLPFFASAFLLAGGDQILRFALSLVATGLSVALVWRRFGARFRAFFRGEGLAPETEGEP